MKLKKIFLTLIIFLIGGLGGILLPSVFARLSGRGDDRTTIINKTEQVIISQDIATEKAYQKNSASLVYIAGNPRTMRAEQSSYDGQAAVARGMGFIVGSDGLILTRREWVPSGGGAVSAVVGSETLPAKIVKRSDESGLVLLKVERSNLPVVSFAPLEDKNIGANVFLIGFKQLSSGAARFVNAGILKNKDGAMWETNIKEDLKLATGTPLINLNGDVVGINAVNSAGYVFAIPSDVIKKFIY